MNPIDLALFVLANVALWARCITYHAESEAMAQAGIISREDK